MTAIGHLADAQLRSRAGDCTELSCLYHGAFNIELMNRERDTLPAAWVDTQHGDEPEPEDPRE